MAQETITGIVKDKDGATVPGAIVHIKHAKIKTVTDIKCCFYVIWNVLFKKNTS